MWDGSFSTSKLLQKERVLISVIRCSYTELKMMFGFLDSGFIFSWCNTSRWKDSTLTAVIDVHPCTACLSYWLTDLEYVQGQEYSVLNKKSYWTQLEKINYCLLMRLSRCACWCIGFRYAKWFLNLPKIILVMIFVNARKDNAKKLAMFKRSLKLTNLIKKTGWKSIPMHSAFT